MVYRLLTKFTLYQNFDMDDLQVVVEQDDNIFDFVIDIQQLNELQ